MPANQTQEKILKTIFYGEQKNTAKENLWRSDWHGVIALAS
jgi:hypothetical protein